MKKMLLLALFFIGFTVKAQEEIKNDQQVSSKNFGVGLQFGQSARIQGEFFRKKGDKEIGSRIGYIFGAANPSGRNSDSQRGIAIASTSRYAFDDTKNNTGLYIEGTIEYVNIKYSSNANMLFGTNGTYQHISLFNPTLGYRWKLGQNKSSIQAYAGVDWAIQIKGKGDVDNKDIDVWQFKLGTMFNF